VPLNTVKFEFHPHVLGRADRQKRQGSWQLPSFDLPFCSLVLPLYGLPTSPTNCLVMPEFFESIPERLIPWLLDQHVFWVASAPLSKDGHVNLSPKGLKGSFRVNNANEVWYEDLLGSGR
jgi:hypothetical protein